MKSLLRFWPWSVLLWLPFLGVAQPQSQPTSKPSSGLTTFDPVAPLTSPQTDPPPEVDPSIKSTQKQQPTSFTSVQDVPVATPLIPAAFDPMVTYSYGPNKSVKHSLSATALAGVAAGAVIGVSLRSDAETIRGGLVATTLLAVAPSVGRFSHVGQFGIRRGLLCSVLRFPAALVVVTAPKLLAEGAPEYSSLLLGGLAAYAGLSAFDIYRTYILYPSDIQKGITLPETR